MFQGSQSANILVVDDEASNRKLLNKHLARLQEPVTILEAASGQEALEIARNRHPDLVLLDIMMPEMDGFETCRRLKADPSTRAAPVIFLSSLDDVHSKTKGFEAGGVDYVSKPFESLELLSRVRTHLQLKGYTEGLEQEVNRQTKALQESKQELQRNYDSIQVVNRLLHLSLQNLSLQEILDQALEEIFRLSWLSSMQKGAIFTYNKDTECLELQVHRNLEPSVLQGCSSVPSGRCLCGRALQAEDTIFEPTVTERHTTSFPDLKPHAHYCVPFQYGDSILGLLNLYFEEHHQLQSSEAGLLRSVSNTLAGIIARYQAEQALHYSNELYRAIFETTQNATCIIDEHGRVALCNNAFSRLFKKPKEEVIGQTVWKSFVHPEDLDTLAEYRSRRLRKSGAAPKCYEFRFADSQGGIKNMLSTVDLIPGTQRTVVSLMDITERKQFEAELERRAFYDSLTGLPNRALFMNRLAWAMERYGNESRYGYAILFLDLDRFRLLNESLGHDVGDQLLQAVASHLENGLDSKHTLARFGGDEFTVLLEEVSGYAEVARLAERIQSRLNRVFSLQEHNIHTTCSIGIVIGSKEYQDHSLVVRDAETAMQRAKTEGQNSIKAFNPEMHEQALKFLHLDTELRQALKKKELFVYYQPILDLMERRIIGFEGLIRWHHPHRGLLMPGDFIALAEDTDIIHPLGRMILETACCQLKAWQESFGRSDLLMNINLSAKQFSQADLDILVRDILHSAGLKPECLELEITESVIMQNVETSTAMLNRIKGLGVKLAMDDFGTGYSSLSYLQRFPIDSLKIDRSFVWGLEERQENVELIKTIVSLSRNLHKELIAEGIETQAQLEKLKELGCRFGQGYYFAKPMEPKAAERYLQDGLSGK